MFDLKNQACIVGVGSSEYGMVLNQSAMRLQTAALRAALDDAGLTKDDIDGYSTAHGAPEGTDYDEFAVQAGLNLRWAAQYWTHGRWASTSVAHAAMAVSAGLANYVLIMNTSLSPRGYAKYLPHRTGWNEGLRDVGGGQGQVNYHGLDTPGSATALIARDYMNQYGATSEELGAIAVAFRRHAQLDPQAVMHGKPMTLDDYMQARQITPPLRLFDYCLTNDGAVALIVTTAERARALKKTPVYISGHQGIHGSRDDYAIFARPGMGVAMQTAYDYVAPPQPVYAMAGVDQSDVDTVTIYDAFSVGVWTALERFGFCKAGEAHEFCLDGRIEVGGALPINTNGGQLSGSYLYGYNHIGEMVKQLRGECGDRQVPDAQVAQWITPFGDSLLLTKR